MSIKHITIEAQMPPGVPIGDLSRHYPNETFRITNGHWMRDDERILYIMTEEWNDDYETTLQENEGTLNLERIGKVMMVHMKTRILKNLEQKNMTILYPTSLKNGTHRIEFLINEAQLDALKRALPECRVLRISDTYDPVPKLTERQKEIVEKARSLGYFKYPRDVTLTELARLLKISKATLSQTLRAVENKAISAMFQRSDL